MATGRARWRIGVLKGSAGRRPAHPGVRSEVQVVRCAQDHKRPIRDAGRARSVAPGDHSPILPFLSSCGRRCRCCCSIHVSSTRSRVPPRTRTCGATCKPLDDSWCQRSEAQLRTPCSAPRRSGSSPHTAVSRFPRSPRHPRSRRRRSTCHRRWRLESSGGRILAVKRTSCKLGSQCSNAVSDKLSSDKLSLIPVPNGIAKLELIRDEGRRLNGVALPRFVTYVDKFRDLLRTGDQRWLVA